jgi:4-amino-4-deoxy-L-arabinose transferase-like glycosyltransferase
MKKHLSTSIYLSLIIIIGAAFRLWELGAASMGADVMLFYSFAEQGLTPMELMRNIKQYYNGVFPVWFAAHNLFLQGLNLEVTFASVRLLDVITGILTIPVVFGMCRRFGDQRLGLLGALIIAIHPIHIQISRECYFYVAVLLGAALTLWAFGELIYRPARNRRLGISFFTLSFTGYFFLTYVTSASWAFMAICLCAFYILLIRDYRLSKIEKWNIYVFTAGIGILSLPLLFADWALKLVYNEFMGSAADHWRAIFGEKTAAANTQALIRVFTGYLFGMTWLRMLLNAGVIFGLFLWTRKSKEQRLGALSLITLFATAALTMIIVHVKSPHLINSRHFTTLPPFFILFICIATREWVERISHVFGGAPSVKIIAWTGAFFLPVASFALPAVWSIRSDVGVPWQQLVRWTDSALPPNTVVLCDRWFTPFNELRVNPSTNVVFTFTIPNEPPDVYVSSDWRRSAMEFLTRNPDAAFLDTEHFAKQLGLWEEPRRLFARQQSFVDWHNVRLAKLGLAYRAPQPGVPLEKSPFVIYYNTLDDLVDRSRKKESPTLIIPESISWSYFKPWQGVPGWSPEDTQLLWIQVGAFSLRGAPFADLQQLRELMPQQAAVYFNEGRWREYRVPAQDAQLTIFNLTEHELTGSLRLTAIAMRAPLRLSIKGVSEVFPTNLLTSRSFKVSLEPGKNTLPLITPGDRLIVVDLQWITDSETVPPRS